MESLIKPVKNLIKLLKNADKIIDLDQEKWLHPFEILPIAAIVSENNLDYIGPANEKCREYLKYFEFPYGLDQFQRMSTKFIPIYRFISSADDSKSIKIKSDIIDNLTKIFIEKIGSPSHIANAMNLMVDEVISNVRDHSDSQYGWIHAQHYPTKQYLDVCILNTGTTIFEKYKKRKVKFPIKNDIDALKKALQGYSSKPEMIRGSGLRTFVNMIRKGFKGEFVIISGSAIAYGAYSKIPIVQKISIKWQGTIIAFRIPDSQGKIDYTKYIE